MSEANDEAGRGPTKPASLPVRIIAFLLDVLLVKLLLAVVVALAFFVSDRIRLASPVFSRVDCKPAAPLPAGATMDSGTTRICTQSFFGLARNDRIVVRVEATPSEDERIIEQAVDREGRPVQVRHLDDLLPLLLAVYLIALEWRFGTTIAKWFVAILVRSATSETLSLAQSIKRTLVRVAVLLPITVGTSARAPEGESWRLSIDLAISRLGMLDSPIVTGLQFLAFVYFAHLIVAAAKGWPLLHDRWTGTTVVREYAD